MQSDSLQGQYELGQEQLTRMDYLHAEATLADAERAAWRQKDLETLARLYLPLQEAHRQRRQRCGEGIVCLDLLCQDPTDHIDGRHVVENYPQGQLLVAGWKSIAPAVQVRRLQAEHALYLETFLAAVYPVGGILMVAILPWEDMATRLPQDDVQSLDQLQRSLPQPHLLFRADEFPSGSRKGTAQTFGQVCDLWERLHRPLLACAQTLPAGLEKLAAYRRVIEADYACELAHQHLADLARNLARST